MNNEYLIQKETLTGLADEIRVLSCTTAAMGLDDMTTNIADANTEVDAQAAKIAEISALLEGKGVPGGGSGGAVETCTITFTTFFEGGGILYYSDGTQIIRDENILYLFDVPITVVKNSIICIYTQDMIGSFTFSNDAAYTLYFNNHRPAVIAITGDCAITPVPG